MTNKIFYDEISQLRDLFHKYGTFDDSNAKLDEISKYIAIYIYQLQNQVTDNNLKDLISVYENDNDIDLVRILKTLFQQITSAKEFLNDDNSSIFGNNPLLNIEDEDNSFAYHLIKLVVKSIESIKENTNEYNFDLLNESFGHFIRDNFRNHIEDAQYMTPSEVVELMCNIAINDIENSDLSNRIQDFIICDPCCGVGSFLSTFYKINKLNNVIDSSKLTIVGQDKVSRMVRLAKINMLLFNNHKHSITNGNSLTGHSALDNYRGKVDLILTNPPFGAKFTSSELRSDARYNYPLLHDLILKNGTKFDSEVLFVDRCLSLLKPSGKLLAVLPDSVISSSGLNATLRHRLINSYNIKIKAIIELPSVTFAQAGTRTKTSILYLEKINDSKDGHVFIAQSEKIGFEVSTKKGATVKIQDGENDLINIFEVYKNIKTTTTVDQKILNESPSCVLVKKELLNLNSWTPSHFNARKLIALKGFEKSDGQIELVKLQDIVNFGTKERRKEYMPADSKCISVLHILNDDNLNYEDLLNYKPKFPGIVCKPGDILFSKINPRILRVLVVPELGLNLTCSSEFEIMNTKIEISNYGIKLLLMLPSVQTQINYLTSGTSSSHNRIKTQDLANVLIPIPKKHSTLYNELMNVIEEYETRNKSVNNIKLEINCLKKEFFQLVS